ncbi:hypothetical protein L1049_017426 [Liquidambar formosana]|uniref:Uncharacterized protein n=1 Tax=Liquidambar formosana TaxID=63359 RepID=A0AAP0X875_LIQFO
MIGVSGLSTEKVIRVAKARFTEFSSQRFVDPSFLSHHSGSAHFDLSDEEIKGVELVRLLLAAAKKFFPPLMHELQGASGPL